MAIDTANKRYSILNFGSTGRNLMAEPDTSVDDADRFQLLNLYAGITLAGGATAIAPRAYHHKHHNLAG